MYKVMTIKCIDNSEYPSLLTNGQIYNNAELVGLFYFFKDNSGTMGAFSKDFFIEEEVGIVTMFLNSPAVNHFNNN